MHLAIDVDNTLLVQDDGCLPPRIIVNEKVRAFLIAAHGLGIQIIVWSGGGAEYARMATRFCGIDQYVWRYLGKGDMTWIPAITLDDQLCTLGLVNIKLPGDIVATPWMGGTPFDNGTDL